MTSEKHELQNFLQKMEHCVAYSAKNFAKSFFSDITKVQNAGCQCYGSKRIKSIFANNGNSRSGFGAPFQLLSQAVLITSIKSILSGISLSIFDFILKKKQKNNLCA